jgi:hypothetical protein
MTEAERHEIQEMMEAQAMREEEIWWEAMEMEATIQEERRRQYAISEDD